MVHAESGRQSCTADLSRGPFSGCGQLVDRISVAPQLQDNANARYAKTVRAPLSESLCAAVVEIRGKFE